MSADTIEKGSKVRVEFEGEYKVSSWGDPYVETPTGGALYPHDDVEITVVERPLPPEPALASIVTNRAGRVFKRFSTGWLAMRDASVERFSVEPYLTWGQVVKALGGRVEVRYLTEDPARRNDVPDLKKSGFYFANALNGRLMSAGYETFMGEGRIKIYNDRGDEVFRIDMENADKLTNAIRKTIDT